MKVTNGLPFISNFNIDDKLSWQMSRSEKYCLIELLESIRPDYAIEIGTYQGGSLQVISKYSETVFSIDISEEPQKSLQGKFPNVKFIVNKSTNVLHELFRKIEQEGRQLNFILVDGDHTKEGVYNDLKLILDYPHKYPLTILLHDSFNPQCRKGMKQVDFKQYPNVSYVELDYICGSFWTNEYRQMWGGLAMVRLSEKVRDSPITVNESYRHAFRISYLHSVHPLMDRLRFLSPLKKKIYRLLRLKHSTDRYYNFDNG